MAGKKSFAADLSNPALAFISGEKEPAKKKAAETEQKAIPEAVVKEYIEVLKQAGYQVKPEEKKTVRVQLVMKQSLFKAAKDHIKDRMDPVTERRLSFNQYVSDLIQADVNNSK